MDETEAKRIEELGFVFKIRKSKTQKQSEKYDLFCDALKQYKALKGDLYVPQLFVIPRNDSDWPVSVENNILSL